ncbi:MAG: hypothetical protein WC055_00180 [Melioribacteraceae bacterium]
MEQIPEAYLISAGISKLTGESKYHGQKKHPLYGRWMRMKRRCYDTNNKSYKSYGAKGVYVCNEWLHDFKPFYDWCMDNGYSQELDIDRINPCGPYSPCNCRFITKFENSQNKRKKTDYRGVSFNKTKNIYSGTLTLNRSVIFRRNFKDELRAAIMRDKFIAQNNLPHEMNFPERRDEFVVGPKVKAFSTRKSSGFTIHGLSKSPIHKRWDLIKKRRNETKGRITICEEWDKNFMSFYNWSIENGFDEKLALFRKDISLGYSPDNCEYKEMVY